MYFPSRSWVLIKKFMGIVKHPTAIIMNDFIEYAKRYYYYNDKLNYKFMLYMRDNFYQTELISFINNTSELFSIRIAKNITKYELSIFRKRKYIEVTQIIRSPKKDEHYYQIVIVKDDNIFHNKIITWKDKVHKDKFLCSY